VNRTPVTASSRRVVIAALGIALLAASCTQPVESADTDPADAPETTSESAAPATEPVDATTTEVLGGAAPVEPAAVAGPRLDPTADDATALFDQDALHTFDLTVPDEALLTLDGDPTAEVYVEGTLGFQGETFGTVGVRHKGSIGSYIGCVDGPDQLMPSGAKTCTKISMKVKINWEDSKTEFFGQRKIQFNSMNRDDSMLHERLGYWLFQEMGIPAPRSTHARVNLNGEYLGIFALTELVDGRFTRANFEDGKGNLYKGIWPFWSDFTVSPEAELRAGLRTNEDDPETTTDMITAFASELLAADPANRRDVLEKWTDVDALLRYAVVDRMIHHDDGPMHWYCNESGCGNQNFYWYEETEANMLRLIPWDLDGAFENNTTPSPYTDIADGWGEITADCEPFAHGDLDLLQRSAACDPLIGTLTTYTAEYDALHAELLAGPFSPERVDEQLDTWIAQIEPAVAEAAALHADAVTIEEWQAAVDEFRRGLEISRTS
jgi:hypothetical protein